MKKNIWILNHYATNTFKDQAGRHYWFAENLIKEGYNPTIFCASTIHNSDESIDTGNHQYLSENSGSIPFVFVNTPKYGDNGKKRIINMLVFYKKLFSVTRDYAEKYGKPDIILASSVHPLTMVAGIKIAKKFGITCICEVRDLWPESIVAYGVGSKKNPLIKTLYHGERWIYRNADKLIFTIEGGKDYIIDRGWSNVDKNTVDLNKVYHINNGVDLETFNNNKKTISVNDKDLENPDTFKVVYTGSIRKVNNVRKIVKVAELFKEKEIKNIKFLIYGDGTDKPILEKYCSDNNLENVVFKGKVDKNKIPYILSNSDLNIIHFQDNDIKKYGASLNKLFEYFASGKPTISDCEFGYDLIKKYKAGLVFNNGDVEQLGAGILEFYEMPVDTYNLYSDNAFKAAKDYDFKKLTLDLINVIEN
ncbi:glycosyltransferase WbuB [Planococcus kocurii]|uniref:Glycosyltransferase WbuB n=1 Tax=Planococcus kocurii TaxID=1374 RepID=A0ABN4JVY5_9BACL|nr:glycosyltransferase family 4 protein [Planococcus kocurii]ALS77870.1 glycosyltransferase WbuB [Planococcus kocurii]